MDILEKIHNYNHRDIIISLPHDKSWLDYLTYFMELKTRSENLEIIISDVPMSEPGNKCYVVFDGFIEGWMVINKIKETPFNEICLELFPLFNHMSDKIPMHEIEGYKYYFDDFDKQ